MAEVGKCNANNILLLKSVFSVNGLKEEELQNDDFADCKVQISETSIFIENVELKDQLIGDEMEQQDISITLDNMKTELPLPKVENDMIHDNIKIEQISENDRKIEFNNGLLYCERCHIYYEDYCIRCGMLVHILNKNTPNDTVSREQVELPDDILEMQNSFGQFGIFALKVIPEGVKFGPFTGLNRTERSWKIRGGKLVATKDKPQYLIWMQYINQAKNICEKNLCVVQHSHNLYYQSTCQIQEGDELLVYFGEKYEGNLNRDIEMDFIPTSEHIFEDVFACTFCCLGFSSKLYLAEHKRMCLANLAGEFSIEELTQCPCCKIHLEQREYISHHMAYCFERSDRKLVLPTADSPTSEINGRKTRPHLIYECQQCKYRTKYKKDLKNHANLHYKVKMYKCGICCRRFKTKEVLRLHVEGTHILADIKEDSKNSTEDSANTHIKAEHSSSQVEVKQFKCSSCEFQTKYKISLKRHIGTKHLNKHTDTRHLKEIKYKCDTCEYKTNQTANLKAHIETSHLKVFKYRCDTCDYRTNWMSNIKSHIEARHVKEFKYKCDRCGYKADQKSHLKIHVTAKHLRELKYKCDTCEYTANQKSQLKRHIETKHLKEFKYKCDVCDYKSYLKSHLERHIEAKHLKEFKYKCDTCKYKSNGKAELKIHIKTKHLKEFKYKCDTCDYKTNSKSNLGRHTETKHLNEFKYKCDTYDYYERENLKEFKFKCDLCEHRTNWEHTLKAHVKSMHFKEFKYKCDMCDYKTYYKSSFKKHIERIHLKEYFYKCETCLYKTYCISNLRRHIKTKHL